MATYFDLSFAIENLNCVLELKRQVVTMKDENKIENVILQGTVTEIRPARGPHPHHKWLVSLQVNSVIAGDFTGPTFSFNIHSPEKSRIVIGGQYVIELVRIGTVEYALKAIEPWKEKDDKKNP